MKKGIVEGNVVILPDDVEDDAKLAVWDNCIYVYSYKNKYGKVYLKKKGGFELLFNNVLQRYDGSSNYLRPYYYTDGYAFLLLDGPKILDVILDCISGKKIYKGRMVDEDSDFISSRIHRNDLFLIRRYPSYDYILIDGKGNQLMPEEYIKDSVKACLVEFQNSELTGVKIMVDYKSSNCKVGILNVICSSEETIVYEAIPPIYDEIILDKQHVIQDRYGNYHFPTYKAIKRYGKKEKYCRFSVTGKRISTK